MARIGRTDPVLRLLRERLQRGGSAAVRAADSTGARPLTPLQRARASAAMAALDPDGRRKLLVRALLAEQLGDGVANDAAFQRIGDRVLAMLDETDEGRALIAAALDALESDQTGCV